MTFREIMIATIRHFQYYEAGVLESKSDEQLREIYERVIDWVEGIL